MAGFLMVPPGCGVLYLKEKWWRTGYFNNDFDGLEDIIWFIRHFIHITWFTFKKIRSNDRKRNEEFTKKYYLYYKYENNRKTKSYKNVLRHCAVL